MSETKNSLGPWVLLEPEEYWPMRGQLGLHDRDGVPDGMLKRIRDREIVIALERTARNASYLRHWDDHSTFVFARGKGSLDDARFEVVIPPEMKGRPLDRIWFPRA
eukprot:7807101-Pyramimonas_sp.AAC.1